MTDSKSFLAERFRRLHDPGRLLVLANAWDAGSARLIESCGAAAIATTSAGVAWSHGYPDGDALPAGLLTATIAEIARVISVPLSADVEGGYSTDPRQVEDTVAAVADAGAVGINIEDGSAAPELLCAKIAAARRGAARAGVELFVNARTDVYLRGLVPSERAVAETIARARLYREAGCDGVFVPGAADARAIGEIAAGVDVPLNVMLTPTLPPIAELRRLGVRRVSAGSALSSAAHGITRVAATRLFTDGVADPLFATAVSYPEMNALLSGAAMP